MAWSASPRCPDPRPDPTRTRRVACCRCCARSRGRCQLLSSIPVSSSPILLPPAISDRGGERAAASGSGSLAIASSGRLVGGHCREDGTGSPRDPVHLGRQRAQQGQDQRGSRGILEDHAICRWNVMRPCQGLLDRVQTGKQGPRPATYDLVTVECLCVGVQQCRKLALLAAVRQQEAYSTGGVLDVITESVVHGGASDAKAYPARMPQGPTAGKRARKSCPGTPMANLWEALSGLVFPHEHPAVALSGSRAVGLSGCRGFPRGKKGAAPPVTTAR